jgi:protein-disulfide isomerase
MIRRYLALFALAFPIAALPAATPRHAIHRAVDWTRTVALTTDGGVRMGNPQAKVRLVEYFSYTCPHCAAFSGEASTPLATKYIVDGRVSYELRSALRDAIDLSVALAVRCVPPARFFPANEAVMAAQQDWSAKAIDYVGQHRDDLNSLNKTAAIHAMLANIGVEPILARYGVTSASLDRCLASKDVEAAIQKTTEDAWNVKHISGTPGFMINDALQPDIHDWATLEPAIQSALKG